MNREIKFALVGCGKIGARHAIQMERVGKLVAVCDIVREKAEYFAKSYHAHGYFDLNELLEKEKDVDVVAICTPNGLHASQTIQALKAGHNVLCEKPMALSVEDCRAMINAAEDSGKKLVVVKQNRFNPPVVAVKKLIDENKLGKIWSVQVNCFWNRNADYYKSEWRGTKELDGGTLFTQFSHFIDIMYWLVGDVTDVQAFVSNFAHKDVIEFEDSGVINFRFQSGAIGAMNYSVNSFEQNMEGSITILAEKGTVKIGGEYLNRLEYAHLAVGNLSTDLHQDQGQPNDYGNYKGSMSNHDKVYDNLVNVFEDREGIVAGGLDGLKTVEIIEKILGITHTNSGVASF